LITTVTFVALLEIKLLCAAAGDQAFDPALSNLDDDMSHDIAQRHFYDFSFELISR
jgi:hypothetical protein